MNCGRGVPVTVLAWVVFSATVGPAEGARILAVETISGRSHWNFMSAVLRALTGAGHHVTVFTPFPDGGRENYTEVDTGADMPVSVECDLTEMITNFSQPFRMANVATVHFRGYCDSVYWNRRFAEMVSGEWGRNATFDVIFVEPTGDSDFASHLANALGSPPVVYVIPSPMITFAERSITGHSSNPACVAHQYARHAAPKTFAQRLTNAALQVYSVLRTELDRRVVKVTDPQPYDYSSPTVFPAVVFQNSHRATEAPRPVPPNVIDVGGIHLKPPGRIPRDILEFIEDSPHGVIYFTFGSTIKLSSMPIHIKNVFKRVFAKIPQKVLWKYETEMNDMPKNVLIKKWLPQRELLLHPKVKLFISHGGISGVYETVDAGVPLLGFPLFYDQSRNIEHLVDVGMAKSMDVLNVSEDVLLNAITELINNKKYMQNAKITSMYFKDRPMTPAQSVVHWTEYVIRHKGAPHIKSHALNLPWYQYLMLDVIFVMIILMVIVFSVMYKILKWINDHNLKYLYNNTIKNEYY